MRNIKSFDTYINEELDTQTYKDAAKKLQKLGHKDRAKKIFNYAIKNEGDDIALPIILDDKEHLISINSIEYTDNDGTFLRIFDQDGKYLFDITPDGGFYHPDTNNRRNPLNDRKSALNFYKVLKNWDKNIFQMADDDNNEIFTRLFVNRLYGDQTFEDSKK